MFRLFSSRQQPPPLAPHSMLAALLHNSAFGAVLLLLAAGLALWSANSRLDLGGRSVAEWYHWLLHLDLGFSMGGREVTHSLHFWINDALMAVFFYLVGLEIKREVMVGELASVRRALLPVVAAIGGMVVPATIYWLVNGAGPGRAGWGIPMATDIAFAGGVVGLMSRRIPSGLAVFLIALAIVDDLGAIIVIAVFYTPSIDAVSLEAGLGCIVLSFLLGLLGVRRAPVFVLLGVVTWFCFLRSGVHATLAGVLFAFTVPASARYDTPLFLGRIRELLRRFEEAEDHVNPRMVNARQQALVRAIEAECVHVEAPLQRVEQRLHPLVAFVMLPLFAFANAGVAVDFGGLGGLLVQPVAIGILLGLAVGKPLGIVSFSALAVRSGLAELPVGVRWLQLTGVGCLAGIGFTMSLFVAQLAFADVDGGSQGGGTAGPVASDLLHLATLAIMCASAVASLAGIAILLLAGRRLRGRVVAGEDH